MTGLLCECRQNYAIRGLLSAVLIADALFCIEFSGLFIKKSDLFAGNADSAIGTALLKARLSHLRAEMYDRSSISIRICQHF